MRGGKGGGERGWDGVGEERGGEGGRRGEGNLSVLCEAVISVLPAWRKNFANFPVLTWTQFVDSVHSQINPLAGDLHLREIMRQLHYMGEVGRL